LNRTSAVAGPLSEQDNATQKSATCIHASSGIGNRDLTIPADLTATVNGLHLYF